MPDVSLILGDIQFYDFEVPQKMPFGGEQHLVVHDQPGGGRIVDVMGPREHDITWSGHFRGADAEERAQALDALRQAGQVLSLSWSSNLRQVIIKDFKPVFQQLYEIPYTITCLVIPDQGAVGDGDELTSGQVGADVGSAYDSSQGLETDSNSILGGLG